jgi:NAD-dependent dihydropyrimidine dehydrogenase PreA subunit
MARAKRANRGDSERSRWLSGTADAGGREESGWAAQALPPIQDGRLGFDPQAGMNGSQAATQPDGPSRPIGVVGNDPGVPVEASAGGRGSEASEGAARKPRRKAPSTDPHPEPHSDAHPEPQGEPHSEPPQGDSQESRASAEPHLRPAEPAASDQSSAHPDPETPENTGERSPTPGDWRNDVGTNGRVPPVHPREAGFGTPVRVDEIALAAKALSEDLLIATRGLPESVESRQLRRDLDAAVETFRAVASHLQSTAGSLVRLAASEGLVCGVTWGVCPDHGLTLMNVDGEVASCHVLGCHLQQQAPAERCPQPVAYKVVDAAGPALFTCAGHAIACRLHLDGAVITLTTDSLEML